MKDLYVSDCILDLVRKQLREIDLDPCSTFEANARIGAGKFYTLVDNGLMKPWKGKVWLYPPTKESYLWLSKLEAEYRTGHVTEAIALVKASFGKVWFEELIDKYPVALPRENIPALEVISNKEKLLSFNTAFIYFGEDDKSFSKVFSQIGRVILPPENKDRPIQVQTSFFDSVAVMGI